MNQEARVEAMVRQLQIDETLIQCIHTLHTNDDAEAAIAQLLSIIAMFYDAQRTYIFEYDEDGVHLSNTYEWCRYGVEPKKEKLQNVRLGIVDQWKNGENQDEYYVSMKTMDRDDPMFDILTKKGVGSMIAAPLYSYEELVGFIGVDDPAANTDTLSLIRYVSTFIVNDIQKREKVDKNVIDALADMYLSIILLNLKDDSARMVKTNLPIRDEASRQDSLNKQMMDITRSIVSPIHVEEMCEFADLTTVEERLKGQSAISHEFLSAQDEWCRASFIPVRYDNHHSLEYVILAVQVIDEEKRRELEYQQKLKQALENQNQVYAEVLQIQSNGVFAAYQETEELIMVNDIAWKMLGWGSEENFTDEMPHLLDKIILDDKESIFEGLRNLKKPGQKLHYEYSVRQTNGKLMYVMATAKTVMLSNGDVVVIHSLADVTATKKMEKELVVLSETDALTNISNRGSGERRIEKLLEKGAKGMFILMDVDKFKSVNDTYGHMVGDMVLKEIAGCLKRTFRSSDVVMRLGGDEFAAFAVGITDEEIGRECVARLFEEVDNIYIEEMGERSVTVSLGAKLCVPTENNPLTFDEVYQNADKVMYLAKGKKGNQLVFTTELE